MHLYGHLANILMLLCDGDGNEKMLILLMGLGTGMEIALTGTDGDGHIALNGDGWDGS